MNNDINKSNSNGLHQPLKYNKTIHLDLLKRATIESDSTLSLHLLIYSVIVINHLNWEIADQYLEMLEQFSQNKLTISEFRSAFFERYRSIVEVASILETKRIFLCPHPSSEGFE